LLNVRRRRFLPGAPSNLPDKSAGDRPVATETIRTPLPDYAKGPIDVISRDTASPDFRHAGG